MARKWMPIIEASDDPSLGAALVRLAGQAAAMHRAVAADQEDRRRPVVMRRGPEGEAPTGAAEVAEEARR